MTKKVEPKIVETAATLSGVIGQAAVLPSGVSRSQAV